MINKNTSIDTFVDFNFSMCTMPIITVYQNPRDFKDKFVARLFDLDRPTEYSIVKDSLEEIRASLPYGLSPFSRSVEDDPTIVEVWL